MKNLYIIGGVVIIVIVLLAVFAKSQIKSMMYGSPAVPTPQEQTMTPSSPSDNATKASDSAMTVNNDVVRTRTDSSKGNFLTDLKGMSLYIFDKDTKPNASACTGKCLTAWPAYTTNEEANDLPENITTFKRADNGKTQYAWKGMPLYYYVSDEKPGDVTGDGVGGIWHLVKP